MSKISLDPKKEKRIIDKSRKNREEFAPLYKHYQPYIKKFFSLRVYAEPEAVEDLTSDVFKKAIAGLDNFQWQGVSFSAWLYKIARNTLIDYYRSVKKNISLSELEATIKSKDKGPDELAFDSLNEELLKRLLQNLPERERNIIYMKFYDGYTNKTIAEVLDLSETNVSTIVYRSVRKLREEIERM